MANINQLKDIIKRCIKRNEELIKAGKSKITYNIEGEAGLGKTQTIEQIAQELGYQFIKVNLAQTEECGDILGMPLTEFKVVKDNSAVWVNKNTLNKALEAGYKQTTETRMGYAAPAWVPKNNQPTILVFDDYNRATPMIMQAVMEIISRNEYISWKLPDFTYLFLTSNPENGDYNVTVTDAAQRSRYITLKADFDVNTWAIWAEENEIPGNLINFALYFKEIFDKPSINARNYTMFAQSLGDINIEKEGLFINTIAEGTFSVDGTGSYITEMLQSFVRKRLHKLITPEEMLSLPWEKCYENLKDNLYDKEGYRADVACILTLRFMNYINNYFKDPKLTGNKSTTVNERILKLIHSEEKLLSEDLLFALVKHLCTNFRQRCAKLLTDPKVIETVVS